MFLIFCFFLISFVWKLFLFLFVFLDNVILNDTLQDDAVLIAVNEHQLRSGCHSRVLN